MILARMLLDTSPPRRHAFLLNVCGRHADGASPVLIALSGGDFLIVSESGDLATELVCFEQRVNENLWLLDYAETSIAYQTWEARMEELRSVLDLLGREVVAERELVEWGE